VSHLVFSVGGKVGRRWKGGRPKAGGHPSIPEETARIDFELATASLCARESPSLVSPLPPVRADPWYFFATRTTSSHCSQFALSSFFPDYSNYSPSFSACSFCFMVLLSDACICICFFLLLLFASSSLVVDGLAVSLIDEHQPRLLIDQSSSIISNNSHHKRETGKKGRERRTDTLHSFFFCVCSLCACEVKEGYKRRP
jgi:hypothetical protein